MLLIDGDLRIPSVAKKLQIDNAPGLADLLRGKSKECFAFQNYLLDNWFILPSGDIPPNPSELLGSTRMKELVEELQTKYDYVFVDMPPLCVVADALVVAPNTAGVVLVARHNQTMYEEFAEALEKVETTGAKLLGVVLTDMKVGSGNYGRYGRYGYGRYGRYERRRYYQRYDYEYSNNSGK